MATPDKRVARHRSDGITVLGTSDGTTSVVEAALERAGLDVRDRVVRTDTAALERAFDTAVPGPDALAVVLDGTVPDRPIVRAVEAATATTPTVVYAPRTDHEQSGRLLVSTTAGSNSDGTAFADFDWPEIRRCVVERAGAVRAERLGRLVDAVETLARQPTLSGDRVAIVSNAGGPGVMAADAVGTVGLSLATFTDATREELDNLIPAEGSTVNPIDLLGDAALPDFARATELVLDDDGVDAVVIVSAPSALFSFDELANTLTAVVDDSSVPVVASLMGGETAGEGGSSLGDAGVPVRFDPFAAVDCLAALQHDDRPGFPPVDEPPDPDRGWWGSTDSAAGEGAIDRADPEALCRAYGIPTALDDTDSRGTDVGADPVECSLRIVRDDALGPTVVAGIAPFDDVLDDIEARLAPLSDRDAAELFELQAGPLLRGVRGSTAVDLDALQELALRCSRIAIEQPTLDRLVLDPVVAGPDGVRVDGASLSTTTTE